MAKSNIVKPTDASVQGASTGIPFKKCPSCGTSIQQSQPYCYECKRLVALGMRTAVKQPVDATDTHQDTQEAQSNPNDNHSGYRSVPGGSAPSNKPGKTSGKL